MDKRNNHSRSDAVLDLISGHISESDLATELQGKIENSVDVSEAAQAAL